MSILSAIFTRLRGAVPTCAHLRVRETMSCDAICCDCGKNLGFIQPWRDANKGNPNASEIGNDPGDPLSWTPKDREMK